MSDFYKNLKDDFWNELRNPGAYTYTVSPLNEEETHQALSLLTTMTKLYNHVYDFIQKNKIGHPSEVEKSMDDFEPFVKGCIDAVGYWSPTKED